MISTIIYHLYQKGWKLIKSINVYAICMIKNYVIHIRALKEALNRGIIIKRVHRGIQLNQKAWLKSDIDMNTKLRKEANNNFEKKFFHLMNNVVFRKTTENVKNTEI